MKIVSTTGNKKVRIYTTEQSCTTLDSTRGSGRVRKFTGNGRVQFGQKLKFNFTLKCRSFYLAF